MHKISFKIVNTLVVYNFRTGPNGPDRTESIKFGPDQTEPDCLVRMRYNLIKYFVQRLCEGEV